MDISRQADFLRILEFGFGRSDVFVKLDNQYKKKVPRS